MDHGSRAKQVGEKGRGARMLFLGVFGLAFWGFVFLMLFRLLRYFRGVPEIGPLIAGKLLGLILAGFFSILLLSNVITALSSFFLARDLDLLASAPVDWFKLYVAKLIETLVHSSWMVLLMAVPMFVAYGVVYSRRAALSADRAGDVRPVPDHSDGDRQRGDAAAREHFPSAAARETF